MKTNHTTRVVCGIIRYPSCAELKTTMASEEDLEELVAAGLLPPVPAPIHAPAHVHAVPPPMTRRRRADEEKEESERPRGESFLKKSRERAPFTPQQDAAERELNSRFAALAIGDANVATIVADYVGDNTEPFTFTARPTTSKSPTHALRSFFEGQSWRGERWLYGCFGATRNQCRFFNANGSIGFDRTFPACPRTVEFEAFKGQSPFISLFVDMLPGGPMSAPFTQVQARVVHHRVARTESVDAIEGLDEFNQVICTAYRDGKLVVHYPGPDYVVEGNEAGRVYDLLTEFLPETGAPTPRRNGHREGLNYLAAHP
jgi:hypothetical protein